MSEYQYYEFVALDRPLTTAEQAEVRQLSTRATITATSFTNGYQWGDFKGSPDELMQRYYDAHLYFANWGTHRVMFRLPRTVLDPGLAEQYCVDPQVSVYATSDHVILDMTSDDEPGDEDEDLEGSLSAIVGARSELAGGDLRPLYLAWLSGYGTWERDEDAFDDEDEDVAEPPVLAGLGSLTASQRAITIGLYNCREGSSETLLEYVPDYAAEHRQWWLMTVPGSASSYPPSSSNSCRDGATYWPDPCLLWAMRVAASYPSGSPGCRRPREGRCSGSRPRSACSAAGRSAGRGRGWI